MSEQAPMVQPWYAPSRPRIRGRRVAARASFSAASTASVPDDAKKAFE
jgi:hypothetical protein